MANKIQLCGFEKAHDEPSGSGYCQKLETFLRATGYTSYEVKFANVFSAPKGKLPYIILHQGDKQETIADSSFIIRHLLSNGITKDLDEEAGLTPAQKAESRAYQAYIEELVYPATVWTRFAFPENWEVLKVETFGKIPFFIRPIIQYIVRNRVKGGLIGHGVGRHSHEEVESILADYIENLCVRLDPQVSKGDWFHGEKVSNIDCVIYGFLANALHMKSNPGYKKLILERKLLKEYVERGTRLWFPEYTNILAMVVDVSSVTR